jgi:hypothetical protein
MIGRCRMKSFRLFVLVTASFLLPTLSQAQSTGRVECARSDDYIYLYSSVTTLDVRKTLQCGEIVQLTGTYDNYYAARTAKGDTGYVPKATIVILKDQIGTGLPEVAAPSRERTPYDERAKAPTVATAPKVAGFVLMKDTPLRVRVSKGLSSATAHAGDAVEFEVLEDVLVDGVVVIARGAKASGTVAATEMKKHFGHDGKLAVSISSVRLSDDEAVPVRGYYEAFGNSNSGAPVQLGSGKDATIAVGTDFKALVDGDVRLKREDFSSRKETPAIPTADATPSLKPQR